MRFGMDYGGTNIKCGVFSDSGEILTFSEVKLKAFTDQGELLDNLIRFAREICSDHNITCGGLAIKGLVNTLDGRVEQDIGAGELLAGIPLRDKLGAALGFPFFIENDARAYAWGEWKFGAGQTSRVMVGMTLGTGLGCALVVDQKPYQGSDPLGGILGGHISIDRNGDICPCGQRGCLEMFCSATALNARVRDSHPGLKDRSDALPDFFNGLRHGKAEYRKTLEAFQTDLAIGVINVIHAYGPDMIVLGGGVMTSSDLILPGLIEKVHKGAWTFPREKVKICAASLGNRAAALGVAFHPGLDN